MKLIYRGSDQDGIDVPALNIVAWKPGEARDVPEEVGREFLERSGEFEAAAQAAVETKGPRRPEPAADAG